MAAIAAMRGGCRLFIRHAAAAFGSHKPCRASPKMAHGHLCPCLLGLVATIALGSNCALTPCGESGITYGFCSFVGYRIVVGKHIFPTPICCSVGSEVAAATSQPSWGLVCLALPRALLLWWLRGSPLRVVAQSAPSLGAPAPALPSSGGPRPSSSTPLPLVGPPPRRSGARESGVWGTSPQAFFSAAALGQSCGSGGLLPPASVLWAKTPSFLFGGFCPKHGRCVLPLVARSRIFAPRLPHCSFDVIGGLSN